MNPKLKAILITIAIFAGIAGFIYLGATFPVPLFATVLSVSVITLIYLVYKMVLGIITGKI